MKINLSNVPNIHSCNVLWKGGRREEGGGNGGRNEEERRKIKGREEAYTGDALQTQSLLIY